jgi:hypothetical protein
MWPLLVALLGRVGSGGKTGSGAGGTGEAEGLRPLRTVPPALRYSLLVLPYLEATPLSMRVESSDKPLSRVVRLRRDSSILETRILWASIAKRINRFGISGECEAVA